MKTLRWTVLAAIFAAAALFAGQGFAADACGKQKKQKACVKNKDCEWDKKKSSCKDKPKTAAKEQAPAAAPAKEEGAAPPAESMPEETYDE